MLSAGSIINGAFRVLREQPAVFAIWTLLHLAATVMLAFAMRAMAGPAGSLLASDDLFLRILPFQLLVLVLMLVLFTASQRAVLAGGAPGLAYLRLGMDELRTFLLAIIMFVLFYALMIVIALVFAVIFAATLTAGGAFLGTAAGVILALALLPIFVWLQVRLSLVFPLTLLRRKIVIGESWRLTKGRFWTLFGGYFALFLIVILLFSLIGALTGGSYWMALMRSGMNPEMVDQAMQLQLARQNGPIGPMMVVGWLVGAAIGTLTIAMSGGALATATRALAVDTDSYADTFA